LKERRSQHEGKGGDVVNEDSKTYTIKVRGEGKLSSPLKASFADLRREFDLKSC
jgi:hypothetical protein